MNRTRRKFHGTCCLLLLCGRVLDGIGFGTGHADVDAKLESVVVSI